MTDWGKTLLVLLAVTLASGAHAASYEADLDRWIERDLVPYVSEQLSTQPRFSKESIRFVVLSDEQPRSAASELALGIRDRLRDAVANQPGLRVVLQRDPMAASEAGSLDCTKDKVHYYVGVEIVEDRRGLVDVNVRALDIADQSWVAGFSRSWRGYLDTRQRRQLGRQSEDSSLRGERGAPYSETQFDLLAAHLAHDLACSLLRQTAGEFVVSNVAAVAGDEHAMLELVGNNLAEFRALQYAGTAEQANATLEGKAHQIDDDLFQYWITIKPNGGSSDLPTLSANAYIRVTEKYASTKLIPAITVELARSKDGFLEELRIVELRDTRSCALPDFDHRRSGIYDGGYSTAAIDCYALQTGASDDAVLFFLNHQLNNGLVRLSGKECRDRTDARIAREGEQVSFALPVDSLMSEAWIAADGWEMAPDRDTYYTIAASDTKAARALSQHIRKLPNRCGASVRPGLEGIALRKWLDEFAAIARHWQESIDWRVIRVRNMY